MPKTHGNWADPCADLDRVPHRHAVGIQTLSSLIELRRQLPQIRDIRTVHSAHGQVPGW